MSEQSSVTPESYGESYRADYMAMYHSCVASAERISERRGNANTFFVTVSTTLLGMAEYFGSALDSMLMPATAGVLMCIIWYGLIGSYKNLNSAKYAVILEMEKNLPAQPFADEWDNIQKADSEQKHQPLSNLESKIPIAFGALYGMLALGSLV